ncbi:hypothetical protein V866_000158 [Kwoniella sp. B9012]|uniref:Uncharacterized protein n=1 Tax=Kwoniella europaea PYCC6329 TaxID=1423913 RepID=A0AAX4K8Y2_9TREE
MSFNIATKLPSSLSQSLKSLSLKSLGISTLSTRPYPQPYWTRRKEGSTYLAKVRDVLTDEEYLLVCSTDRKGFFRTSDTDRLSFIPTTGPRNERSSRKSVTTKVDKANCISLSNDKVFRINDKPLVTQEGTYYYAKPLSFNKTTSIEAQEHQKSPIIDSLKSKGLGIGDCLGLNILIRDHEDLLDGNTELNGEGGKQVEIRSLYSLSPSHGQGSIDIQSNPNSAFVDDDIDHVSWYNPTLIRELPEDSEMYTVGAIPLDEVLGNLDK